MATAAPITRLDAFAPSDAAEPAPQPGAGNLVLVADAGDRALAQGRGGGRGEGRGSPEGGWPGLLERLKGAARYVREVEDHAQEQEFRVKELLEHVRADMDAARAQIHAAEEHARDIQVRATRLIQVAEERAQAAEERAAAAERMLQRISETIEAEFVVQGDGRAGADHGPGPAAQIAP